MLRDILERKRWEIDIRCMDSPGVALPDSLKDYTAFAILGGPMGAYEEEDYPYLYRVQELIREAVSIRMPTLGICLGGQLIARALGAHVRPNRVKEIGWYPVHLTKEGQAAPLLAGLPPEFPVFQWHGDTFALPDGAVLLATGQTCTNQAFVYKDCIWALQFHLEVTPTMIGHWAGAYASELEEFGGLGAARELVLETLEKWNSMQAVREQFLDNIEVVLGR